MGIRSYLKVILIIMIPQFIPFNEAMECTKGQYEVNGLCCFICDTGSRVENTFTTTCLPCDPGTYITHQNPQKKCLPCRICDPGTDRNDTICEKCLEEAFSPNGTLDQCLPWTNCTAQGLIKEKSGNDTIDVVCSPDSGFQTSDLTFLIPAISIGILIIFLIIITNTDIFRSKKNQPEANDQERGFESSDSLNIHPPLEANGLVINIPVLEVRQEEWIPLRDIQEP